MKTLATANFNLARDFVKANARPVDEALFAYTFEEGTPDGVWDALAAFMNQDGERPATADKSPAASGDGGGRRLE